MPRFVRRQRERQAHPKGVAEFDRNRWPTSVGTGGRIASESVADLARITQFNTLPVIFCEEILVHGQGMKPLRKSLQKRFCGRVGGAVCDRLDHSENVFAAMIELSQQKR